MLFNSFEFLFIFLPLVYVGYLLVQRVFGRHWVYPYLAVASLLFYAQFSLKLAVVLATSVTFNFFAARLIMQQREEGAPTALLTTLAIAFNLAALGFFKYANFFIDVANTITEAGFTHLNIVVAIGMSFYTFTQIGYLLDAGTGHARKVGFGRYFLFASFFPCVTAGPLLGQREFFDQMDDKDASRFSPTALAMGITLFSIGLFKKVILAESLAPYANLAFDGVAMAASIDQAAAWLGALAYTLQLYFDFSGYSDMAIALGFIFGIRLPLNFNAPFKQTSISGFWRCWHMTMTRFFTTYLYTPVAMKATRRAMKGGYSSALRWLTASAVPLFYTFLLAGIWHGAGWTFVLYGAIHGAALAVDHGWRHFKMPSLGREVGWLLTMCVVVSGLVVFRAPDLNTAYTILSSMWLDLDLAPTASEAVRIDFDISGALVLALWAFVLCAPTSQDVMRNAWLSSDPIPEARDEDLAPAREAIRWQPSASWALFVAVALVIAVTSMGDSSGFLYYQF